jgi:SAM-dependent methyltransferase
VTDWSAGRYDAVGDRIAPIAGQVVDAVGRRLGLAGAAVVDLACGTGSAALAAAHRGARVTAVDLTPELVAIAARRDGADAVDWRTGDAADTGLPTAGFDAAMSNMGIIFVPPEPQVGELTRLVKPGGVLAFSAWVRDAVNPFFDPIVSVLGRPPATGFTPDQWGDPDIVGQRLAGAFSDIAIDSGTHDWVFDSPEAALRFVTAESPMHVDVFTRVDDVGRDRLTAAFTDALASHRDGAGVRFGSSYVVVTATRTDAPVS